MRTCSRPGTSRLVPCFHQSSPTQAKTMCMLLAVGLFVCGNGHAGMAATLHASARGPGRPAAMWPGRTAAMWPYAPEPAAAATAQSAWPSWPHAAQAAGRSRVPANHLQHGLYAMLCVHALHAVRNRASQSCPPCELLAHHARMRRGRGGASTLHRLQAACVRACPAGTPACSP